MTFFCNRTVRSNSKMKYLSVVMKHGAIGSQCGFDIGRTLYPTSAYEQLGVLRIFRVVHAISKHMANADGRANLPGLSTWPKRDKSMQNSLVDIGVQAGARGQCIGRADDEEVASGDFAV